MAGAGLFKATCMVLRCAAIQDVELLAGKHRLFSRTKA